MQFGKHIVIGALIGLAVGVVGTMAYLDGGGSTIPAPVVGGPSTGGGATGITFPLEGFPVRSPETVAGVVDGVFENQFAISVLDANGVELGTTPASAWGDIGQPAVFVEEVTFGSPTTPTGTIRVWDTSAQDGSKNVLAEVTVSFQ